MSPKPFPRGTAVLLLSICALAALFPPASADRGRATGLADLPPWVREAAGRSVDPDGADAVWLHEEMVVEPLPEGGVRVTRRFAGKVLEPAGLELLGSWTLLYRQEDEVLAVQGWNILPDGAVRRADPRDDVVDRPAIAGFSIFEDSRARVISPPGIRVGSIAAYEDVRVVAFDGGARGFSLGSPARPTAFSRFALRVPEGWGREALSLRAEGIELERQESSSELSFVARDLRPIDREELAPPAGELLPVIWYRWWSPDGSRGFEDWDAVALWYDALTEGILEDAGEAADIGARLAPAKNADLPGSLIEAHAFAARQVRYVSIQIGIGGYRPVSPAEVCRLRYGDCKAKTFLMRALVGAWGIDTYPVLVRTEDLGPLVREVPCPTQFNHVITGVRLPDGVGGDLWPVLDVEGVGRVAFLDATSSNASTWALREDVQGTTALLLTPDRGVPVQLPLQPSRAARVSRRMDARVDEYGAVAEATLVESRTGTAAARARRYYGGMTGEERQRELLEDLQDRFLGTSLVEYEIQGLHRPEEPLVATIRLAGGRLGQRVAELLIVEPGRCGYGLLDRRLPPGPREQPLRVGVPREESLEISIRPPDGWLPEELPQPLDLESPEIRCSSAWVFEEGRLVYRRTAHLLVREVSPERYERFREHLSRVQAEDARAVVLVRPGS